MMTEVCTRVQHQCIVVGIGHLLFSKVSDDDGSREGSIISIDDDETVGEGMQP